MPDSTAGRFVVVALLLSELSTVYIIWSMLQFRNQSVQVHSHKVSLAWTRFMGNLKGVDGLFASTALNSERGCQGRGRGDTHGRLRVVVPCGQPILFLVRSCVPSLSLALLTPGAKEAKKVALY